MAAADSSHKDRWKGEISASKEPLSERTATEAPSAMAS
jgi:hypothetical protein